MTKTKELIIIKYQNYFDIYQYTEEEDEMVSKKHTINHNGEIEEVLNFQNNNVIIKTNQGYRVIYLKENGNYKTLVSTDKNAITFIGGGNFIILDSENSGFYDKAGRRLKDNVYSFEEILYTSVDEQSEYGYVRKKAYKINFGNYVRLFLGSEEIIE